MCRIWSGLYEGVRLCLKKQNDYFMEAREEIADKNMRLLCLTSMYATIVAAVLMLIAPCMVKEWKITIQYVLFLMVMLDFVLFSFWYAGRKVQRTAVVTAACILFYITLSGFAIVIDIFPYPGSPATYMPMILMVFPVIFILRFRILFPIMLGSEIVYIILDTAVKESFLAQNDVFNSIAGLFFSLVILFIITGLRLEDSSAKNRYKRLSTIDSLTSMFNKTAYREEAEAYLRRRDPSGQCAFMIIDLDDFKKVNDRLGHLAGDRLLEKIGTLLLRSFRTTDIVGRFGGDEFTVMLKDLADAAILAPKCREIQKAVGELAYLDGVCCVGFSIGIIVIVGESPAFDEVFEAADRALYAAKAQGKGRHVIRTMRGG